MLRYDKNFSEQLSLIHKINPVIKLFGLFVYIIISLLKYDYLIFIINISLVFIYILVSNGNILLYLKVLWKWKYILVLIYVIMFYFELSILEINVLMFKFLFLLFYLKLICLTTSRDDLAKGFSLIVDKFNIIGYPLKKIIIFNSNILIYISYFYESYRELIINKELKGINYFYNNIVAKIRFFLVNFKLILNSVNLKMKKRVNDLQYRLYNGDIKKIYKYNYRLGIFDYIYLGLNIGLIFFYIVRVR